MIACFVTKFLVYHRHPIDDCLCCHEVVTKFLVYHRHPIDGYFFDDSLFYDVNVL